MISLKNQNQNKESETSNFLNIHIFFLSELEIRLFKMKKDIADVFWFYFKRD